MRGRALVGAALAGFSLSFAFPEADLAPLAWIAIAPLLAIARGRSALTAAAIGFVFGVGFFGSLLIWIKHVGWVAWTVLVVLQAFFPAAFAGGWNVIDRKWGSAAIVVPAAAALWVVLEWLRSLVPAVGFTWGQLAQSQTGIPWLLRVAGIGGGWTVAVVVVSVNGLVARAWMRRTDPRAALRLTVAAASLFLVAAATGAILVRPTTGEHRLRVGIVQGNVERAATGTTYEREIARIRRHVRLTTRLADEDLDLVVWPESSVGLDHQRDPLTAELLGDAARAVGTPLIVGANLDLDRDRYLVVALLVSPEGEVVDTYQKTHLVPFGEYVPARDLLDWIPLLEQVPRDAIAGDDPRNFDVDGVTIATVISFEGDFGPLVRDRIAAGGRALVVATNTSTWEESWASSQHLAFSRVRAAENGVPVIHAALSGISAFVEPDGTVRNATGLYEEAAIVDEVVPAAAVTPYARSGDWLVYLAAVIALGSLVLPRRRTK